MTGKISRKEPGFLETWIDMEAMARFQRMVDTYLLVGRDTPVIIVLDVDRIDGPESIIPFLHETEKAGMERFGSRRAAILHGAGILAAKKALSIYDRGKRMQSRVGGLQVFDASGRPEDFIIQPDEHGAPVVRFGGAVERREDLNVSISHSARWVLAAAWRNQLGVDVEYAGRADASKWTRVLSRVYGNASENIETLMKRMLESGDEGISPAEVAVRLWIAQECAFKILGRQPAVIESFRYEPGEELLADRGETILIRVNSRVIKIMTMPMGAEVMGLGVDITEIL